MSYTSSTWLHSHFPGWTLTQPGGTLTSLVGDSLVLVEPYLASFDAHLCQMVSVSQTSRELWAVSTPPPSAGGPGLASLPSAAALAPQVVLAHSRCSLTRTSTDVSSGPGQTMSDFTLTLPENMILAASQRMGKEGQPPPGTLSSVRTYRFIRFLHLQKKIYTWRLRRKFHSIF